MAKPLPTGVDGDIWPPQGDLANAVVFGQFGAVKPGIAHNFYGAFNVAIWASLIDALTTTAGSANATVASGAGLSAGSAVNSTNVPPGTTIQSIVGTAVVLAFPTISLESNYNKLLPQIKNLPQTNGLVGATIISPDWPTGTTVTGIIQPYVPGPNGADQMGIVSTSANPINNSPFVGYPQGGNGNNRILFQLGANSVSGGVDAAAEFTGAGIEYVGTVQLEYSFNGGLTWLLANVGGGGQLAQYTAGTPVRFIAGECERTMGYRLNCTAYTSGVINYRMSTTGQAATSISIGVGV